jgi:hypothetical protein
MIDHAKYQDQITAIMEFYEVKKEISQLSMPQREKVLGLQYSQGQVVKDAVTGEEVQIVGGIREIVTFSSPRSEGP